MSADLLRRAAALMRERAEAATPTPWEHDEVIYADHGGQDEEHYVTHPPTHGVFEGVVAEASGRDDAKHIASWHPAVALAVADWLDIMANPDAEGYRRPALAVARAYLGENA